MEVTSMGSNFTNIEDLFVINDQEPLHFGKLENAKLGLMILTIILTFCVIVVDILLICVIITKFKRLQSTVNSYIILYAIFNILFLVSEITGDLVYMTTETTTEKRLCLQIVIPSAFLLFNFLLAFALGFDWLIMTFKPGFGQNIQNCYKYFTLLIYFLGCADFLIHLILCITKDALLTLNLRHNILTVAPYMLILLFILVLDYLNLRYKSSIRPTNLVCALPIANIIVLCWSPVFIWHILHQILVEHYEDTDIIMLIIPYMQHVLNWIGISASVIILVALIKINNENDNLNEFEGQLLQLR